MNDDIERARFEEWAKGQVADHPLSLTPCENPSCRCGHHYFSDITNWAWTSWQAALSSRGDAGTPLDVTEEPRLSHLLGKYLNTMVADLAIEGKGQYLRNLFSKYEIELSSAGLTPKICPKCKERLDGNGLIYWCETGHIFDAKEIQTEMAEAALAGDAGTPEKVVEELQQEFAELGWHEPLSMPIPTIDWLRERYENCLRHARRKSGDDLRGWLEDAAYFRLAIRMCSAPEDSGTAPKCGLCGNDIVLPSELCEECKGDEL